MRIMLDEQLSPRRVGEALALLGHDVRCVAAEPALAGLTDDDVLEQAAACPRAPRGARGLGGGGAPSGIGQAREVSSDDGVDFAVEPPVDHD